MQINGVKRSFPETMSGATGLVQPIGWGLVLSKTSPRIVSSRGPRRLVPISVDAARGPRHSYPKYAGKLGVRTLKRMLVVRIRLLMLVPGAAHYISERSQNSKGICATGWIAELDNRI